jgi:hypothetical protein
MKELKFTRTTTFLGRNGEFKSIGLNIYPLEDIISIRPITSRGLTGRARICIPVESLPKLIKILKKLRKENK